MSLWYKCYELLSVVDDMNNIRSWAQDYKCYEHLKVVVDKNKSMLWAQDSRCYEQLDATHGSLALKAYQQNLYLEYYY